MTLVQHAVDGDIHTVTLVDARRRNALSWEMLGELAAIVSTIAADADAGVMVITGAGQSFCAGADLGDIFGEIPEDLAERRSYVQNVYAGFLGIRDLAIPTVAAVNGAAVGAGLNVALACDVVVASRHARFIPSFAEIGLHPGGGCTYFLTERLGTRRATELLLLARTVTGAEAATMGLVDHVVEEEPMVLAMELARTMASRDPALARSIKRIASAASQAGLAATVELEASAQAESIDSATFRRYLQKFAERTTS